MAGFHLGAGHAGQSVVLHEVDGLQKGLGDDGHEDEKEDGPGPAHAVGQGHEKERHEHAPEETVAPSPSRMPLAPQPGTFQLPGTEPLADCAAQNEPEDPLAPAGAGGVLQSAKPRVMAMHMLNGEAGVAAEGEEPAGPAHGERRPGAVAQFMAHIGGAGGEQQASAQHRREPIPRIDRSSRREGVVACLPLNPRCRSQRVAGPHHPPKDHAHGQDQRQGGE